MAFWIKGTLSSKATKCPENRCELPLSRPCLRPLRVGHWMMGPASSWQPLPHQQVMLGSSLHSSDQCTIPSADCVTPRRVPASFCSLYTQNMFKWELFMLKLQMRRWPLAFQSARCRSMQAQLTLACVQGCWAHRAVATFELFTLAPGNNWAASSNTVFYQVLNTYLHGLHVGRHGEHPWGSIGTRGCTS